MMTSINTLDSKAGVCTPVYWHEFAKCNCRISRESRHKMIDDLRQILDNAGGSGIGEQVLQHQTNSGSHFGMIVVGLDRRKIVRSGGK
jgi:hypothetical protein